MQESIYFVLKIITKCKLLKYKTCIINNFKPNTENILTILIDKLRIDNQVTT